MPTAVATGSAANARCGSKRASLKNTASNPRLRQQRAAVLPMSLQGVPAPIALKILKSAGFAGSVLGLANTVKNIIDKNVEPKSLSLPLSNENEKSLIKKTQDFGIYVWNNLSVKFAAFFAMKKFKTISSKLIP